MMKIDQEDFNHKAQHILDTVVKPQVEKYEKAKAEGELTPKPRQIGAAGFLFEKYFYDRLLKALRIPVRNPIKKKKNNEFL